ncbi:ATP-grasp domain-containing protein [Corynebacterium sp. TAE3-ERU12]|uniref:ATP-binding protein n=1 Tax=Corynebacterium sp. TAE3-ERU12 TaxID=2849491 RepID=UPI001C46A729|nr:biotin carboxylase N-terminal domain-containing protein [Corynebacterium sp. TAE3-ERU12]MBV7295186.1 ATP-grasp domain-containing protein [Corynebacterium sp. TAE3-ERU12]
MSPSQRPVRVLVANRGEIATRIIRTLHEMGCESVLPTLPDDSCGIAATLASQAVLVDPRSEIFTDINEMVDFAVEHRADLVHPGYGFFAEDPKFVEKLAAHKIRFIGPNAASMRTLGEKGQARKLAERLGIPTIPGIDQGNVKADSIRNFIEKHGYPFIFKRVDGGGGRGITKIENARDLETFFRVNEQSPEALTKYVVEKYLMRPRHIETQCIVDVDAEPLILSTRECSVQRRNQKLVEEAPAINLTESNVARLHNYSKLLLKAAGYTNAGTCEFLVSNDNIYFLEVNPRIQVEHTVTEEITSIDLVRAQLEIALGKRVGLTEAQSGHAIEARITAEDLGSPTGTAGGQISRLQLPAGPGVRVETDAVLGCTITDRFDPLVAKVIAYGNTRDEALNRLQRALNETVIEGPTTSLSTLRSLLDDSDFATSSYAVTTQWFESDFLPRKTRLLQRQKQGPGAKTQTLVANDIPSVDPFSIQLRRTKYDALSTLDQQTADGSVYAQRPCSVVAVTKHPGDVVLSGDVVLVTEVMKMEEKVCAPISGRIVQSLKVGDRPRIGDLLLRIEKDKNDEIE